RRRQRNPALLLLLRRRYRRGDGEARTGIEGVAVTGKGPLPVPARHSPPREHRDPQCTVEEGAPLSSSQTRGPIRPAPPESPLSRRFRTTFPPEDQRHSGMGQEEIGAAG